MDASMNLKRGFGLVEALVSMFILALLFTGVMMMNYTNHQAALRIATRNEATAIGQRLIDSLQSQGLANIVVGSREITYKGDSTKTTGSAFTREYTCKINVSVDDTTFEGFGTSIPKAKILRAKKIMVDVTWNLGNQTNSINLSTVVQ
jgi:Tfp pilus assembly protein PilV